MPQPSFSPASLASSSTVRRFANEKIILETVGLKKIYGKRTVVNGVSFQVHEGEVVGLLGPNGAGKTTSFRMTCGLIGTNAGRVVLNGKDVSHWPMYRRAREGKMGYLPQDRSVFGSLSTEKNIYLAMELLGIKRSVQKRRCEVLLKKFNLWHVRGTIVGAGGTGGLSGGERRRLEIARSLLSEPRILLLDEPFANVDPNTVTEIQKVVRELAKEGIAILITDHQIDETMEIANYCYVICGGQVFCEGTPIQVLSNPEARERYFGENSQQQLENLMKKIESGGELGKTTPLSGQKEERFSTPLTPQPKKSAAGSGYVVEEDEEIEAVSYRSPKLRRPESSFREESLETRENSISRKISSAKEKKLSKYKYLEEYADEDILPPDRPPVSHKKSSPFE